LGYPAIIFNLPADMERIEIKGFKSIKDQGLDLRPVNILIGSNGSGKSNFLQFFEFLLYLRNEKLQDYVALRGGVNKFLHKGEKVTESVSAKLYFKKTNAYSFELGKGENGFIFLKEGLWFANNTPVWDIASKNYETYLNRTDSRRRDYIRNFLKGLRKYHFHDTGLNAPFHKESHIGNDVHFLYSTGQNLAAFLYSIQQQNQKTYALILKSIQSIAPYFSDFYLAPNENGFLRLLWQTRYDETVYGAADLSDGTLRFIALCVLFLQPNLPGTLIIDEPELGLHPAALARLAGLIQSAAAKGCQVIMATQSTDLISHFEPEDIITVDQIDGESRFNRLDSQTLQPWLEEYTIDDLWKRNIIPAGQPNF
jgi:predicted ATPase